MVEKQGKERWYEPICFVHDEQKMDFGGGIQQSHDEVPTGKTETLIY